MRHEFLAVVGKLPVVAFGVILSFGFAQTQQGWEVTGTVTSDSRPVKGTYVSVFGPSSVPSAVTDNQGSYSVRGVVPGQYAIVVQKKENTSAPEPRTLSLAGGMRLRVDFRIAKGSVISGRVLDRDGRPVSGLVVQARLKTTADRRLRMDVQGGDKTNDLGEYRIPFLPEGVYAVVITPDPLRTRKHTSEPSAAPGRGYPPITFHPGTRDLQAAGLLELRDGAERTGVDIVLQQGPTRCLSFKVGTGFAGERVGAAICERLGFDSPMLSDARVAAGESYEVCGLPPGEYQLSVISYSVGTRVEIPGGVELARNLQILGYQMITALVDKQNVDLGIVEPLTHTDVQGTVAIKDAPPGDSIPSGTRVRIVASELRALYSDMRPALVQSDGTFVLRQVFAGDYGVRVNVPRGYYLIGAYQQGKDVLERGMWPGDGNLKITLGADGATVTGRVLAADGAAIPDASVLLVPRGSGNHLVAQSDQTGVYQFAVEVQSGEYRLVAASDLPRWQRQDAATVARLAANGMELKLGPRESRTVDLKITSIR
jgi:hypothetical protein